VLRELHDVKNGQAGSKIAAQPYSAFFDLMKPVIVHSGDDVTKGYEVILRGLKARPSDFPDPGRL